MAEIAPFKGIRYDISVVGDLGKVTSPPYDIISPDDQVYYHNLHPDNFVRLILGEEFDTDNDENNRYIRARDYLNRWLEEGALKEENAPAIYVYEQQFDRDSTSASVRGFICAVKLHDYADKVIVPHENTLAKPKSHLSRLLRTTQANLDSIYGLYADEKGALDGVMDRAMAERPDADTLDKDGVRHRLWVTTDSGEIDTVVQFMLDKTIAIADGHHRYETSLAYRDEVRQNCGCEAGCCELPSDYVLMTLINVYQPDTTVYPTHRVLGNLDPDLLGALAEKMEQDFEVIESGRERIIDDMAAQKAIGLYTGGKACVIKPKREAYNLLDGSEASRKLELNILHKLILERFLGIDDEKLRNQTNIIYTRGAEEAMNLVDSGQRQAAFLLNHIDVKVVLDVAASGEKMPQKATYFYPKLLSGLVLRRIDG